MPYFLAALTALTLLPAAATAQSLPYSSRCRRDALGDLRCTDSTGSTLRMRTDPLGTVRSTYSGPSGTTTCRTRTDYLGYVTTSCH